MASLTQNPGGSPYGNTTTYTYDDAGRLKTAALSANGSTTTTTYGWNADSDRTSVATTGQPTVTTDYNHADQPASDSNGNSYTYDQDGNLTAISGGTGISYGYDSFGDLTSAATPAGTASYVPDALGRTAAAADTTTAGTTTQDFSYVGTSTTLAAQQSGGTTTNLVRNADGSLVAEATVGGATLNAVLDVHGDVNQLQNASNSSNVWSAVYDPFGNATTTGTAPVDLGFQAMPTDPVTGLVNMGARSYDPASGTFTTVDSVAGALDSPVTLNRYLYGTGDPLDAFDPDGHWSWSGLWDSFTNWLGEAWDTASSWLGQQWDDLSNAAGQDAAQAVATVKQDFTAAYQQIRQVTESYAPTIKATAASLLAGGTVFLGCEALTAGGVAGLTGGITAELGAGAFATGAAAGASGDATSQYLTTGKVNLGEVATSALAGGAVAGSFSMLGDLVNADLASTAAACGGNSFTAGTKVLLANGKHVPISALHTGEKVLAYDTSTGKRTTGKIAAVLVRHDTNRYNLRVRAGHRTATVRTTSNHLFWDATTRHWTPASKLHAGHHLNAAGSRRAMVLGGGAPSRRAGWMWDLTIPRQHDFYITTSRHSAILAHNADSTCGIGIGETDQPAADETSSAAPAPEGATSLAPTGVRLSQSSVNGAAKIIESMKANGWVGDPIDVVRMPDSGLTTIDNTRVVAAHQAGIDVQALIHGFDDPLPAEFIGRFTTPKGGVPSTWGDAIMNRIGAQNSLFRNTYPFGSPFTGWVGN